MKKVEIKNFIHAEIDEPKESFGFLKIPSKYSLVRAEGDNLEVSDGYHTFDELYNHRITLFIALCRNYQHIFTHYKIPKDGMDPWMKPVWRSKKHSDGELCFGTGTQFVLGIFKDTGEQITYHIPVDRWDETGFAQTLDQAPEWDGHTSDDVLKRIKEL